MIINKKPLFFWEAVEYGMYAFFATLPFLIFYYFLYGGSASRSVTLIGFASVLGIWGAVWLWQKGNTISLPKSPVFVSLMLYGIAVVVSGIVGVDPNTSFWSVATRTTGIWYLSCLGLWMFLLWGILQSRIAQYKLILVVVVSTAVYSVLSLLTPEGVGLLFKSFTLDGFTFGNSSFAGMYLFGAFLLSIYYVLQTTRRVWWMYVLPVCIVISPNIINSRIFWGDFSGGVIGEARASAVVIALSLVGLGALWLITKIKNTRIKSVTVYSLFVGALLVTAFSGFSLLSPDGVLRKIYLQQATAVRPLVWEMSQHAISERPIFGWGGDNFEQVFEMQYDNRLLQESYGNEAWFDRAHNVLIDQLVDGGGVGLFFYVLVYVVIAWSLIYVALKSPDKRDRLLSGVLLVYFPLHFIELQTAFDTSISYPMVALMIVLAAVLFERTRAQVVGGSVGLQIGKGLKIPVAVALFTFCMYSLLFGLIPFVRTQITNGYIRTVGAIDKRIPEYSTLFSSSVDSYSFLWRASTDFQRGIAENPTVLSDPKKVELLKKEAVIFEKQYRKHIEQNPTHFRAYLGLADILIYQRLFEVDKLAEAQQVLDEAIKIVPQAPQSYWMKAVTYTYMGEFDSAREYAQKALDLNPEVQQSPEVLKYVEDSIKTFPEIDLYFFRQI